MKNKKQKYTFGNSNYQKVNFVTNDEVWFHLDKDTEGNLFVFTADTDDINSCFKLKYLEAKSEGCVYKLCYLKLLCQSNVVDVQETLDILKVKCPEIRNIDDFFKVTMLSDREFMGNKVPDGSFLAVITVEK